MTIASPDVLHLLLRYDPATGELFWKARNPSMFTASARHTAEHNCNKWNARWAGKLALHCVATDTGYRVGSILGIRAYAHRVIIAMMTGWWPEQADHINGRRADNRWINLRSVGTDQQSKNKKTRKDSLSGVPGVSWQKREQSWRARIGDSGERHLGYFDTFEEAVAVRKMAEVQRGYHPNHGREM